MNKLTRFVTSQRLKHDPEFLVLALWLLYLQQERHERESGNTIESNGVGFNSADAPVLTPIGKRLHEAFGQHREVNLVISRAALSDREWTEVRRRIPKYTNQVIELLNEEGLL